MCCDILLSFIFFFKRKTAYEMRISDWSSDVCSSDLIVHPLSYRRRCAFLVNAWLAMAQRPALPLLALVHVAVGRRQYIRFVHSGLQHRKIGSASCRERVCQYV